jgi:phage terminase large subunit GpA-like protein
MLRKRTDTYSFSHIVGISSPDPQNKRASTDDPIFVEFDDTDKRYWFVPDPKTGKPFRFEMGGADTPHGLKWDRKARKEDGEWDMDLVQKSAFYVTPDGTRIDNGDRLSLVAQGKWVATAVGRTGKRGYHINSFYMPFKSGDFGRIAVAFLTAKKRGPEALRIFIYEYLAEPWTQDVERIYDDQVSLRCVEYLKGQSYFDLHADYKDTPRARLMTVDVQKDHFWYVVREWCVGGKSCLVEWGMCGSWDQLDDIATRHKAEAVVVDSGYGERTTETYDECIRRRLNPAKGDDRGSSPELPWRKSQINPYEGTRRAHDGASISLLLWHTDTFKLMLLARMRGDVPGWYVYRGIERDYKLQVTAEERTPKGWIKRRRDNHLLDCEAMQMLAAAAYGYLSKWDLPEAKKESPSE